jgi:20S proteasome alpha/beta subunit
MKKTKYRFIHFPPFEDYRINYVDNQTKDLFNRRYLIDLEISLKRRIHTMTLGIGIYCSDGVVLGSDSNLVISDGNMAIGRREINKTLIRGSNIFITAGSFGEGQRFEGVLEECINNNEYIIAEPKIKSKILSEKIYQDLDYTRDKMDEKYGFRFSALVASIFQNKHYLIAIENGSLKPQLITESIISFSIGSGAKFSDPFLKYLYQELCPYPYHVPNLSVGIFMTLWALHYAEMNDRTISSPFNIAVIDKRRDNRIRRVYGKEIKFYEKKILKAKTRLKSYRTYIKESPFLTQYINELIKKEVVS